MRIDVHAHYFPPEYLDTLARLGNRSTGSVAFAPGAGVTLDARVGMLEQLGIECQVLSVGGMQPYLARQSDAVDAARLANDLYAEICRRHAGRFAVLAAVPLPHVDAAIDEVRRSQDVLGAVGVTVGCTVGGRPLDEPALDPFFAELDRRAAVLLLHPLGAGVGAGAAEDLGLTWMLGAPFEDTVAAARLVLSGLTSRYPRLRVIVPHLGGTLPFLVQRLDDFAARGQYADIRIRERPSALLKRLWFDTVNQHPAALRCAVESLGSERLLLGTDFPYTPGADCEPCVTYVQESGLATEAVDAILDHNAQHLLGLSPKGRGSSS
jgi:aminocarboxymuconate-semialdehyde decarboxylase